LGQDYWSPENPDGTPPHSMYQGDAGTEEAYVQGSWFAQHLFIKDARDKNNAYKPMCVGDVQRTVLVKESIPKVHQIYEPIVTFELAQSLVDDLEPEGLCMGAAAQGNIEVDYAESLFTVDQLYQLCSVCGMLETGGSNAADREGWVTSDGGKGCIHPPKEEKPRSGEDICNERHMFEDADSKCGAIFDKTDDILKNWYDSCLAEMCNTGDADGVHEETVNVIELIHDITDAEEAAVDIEYADA